jgi:ribosomal protein L11 methyltransferase
VHIPLVRAEEARAMMLELFPEGFEEVEHDTDVELAAYAGPGAEERFWQVFGPGAATDVEPGWQEAWKRFHQPIRVGRLWLGPPWESPDADAVSVVIDPGLAFGTGAHATTRLCLELLLEREAGSVLDLGCGSGVLAVAAAQLGFAPVTALDVDPQAVEAAGENARRNTVEIDVRRADVFADELPRAELAFLNITCDAAQLIGSRLHADELIASGYLAAERPSPAGWVHRDRREAEGWAADLFSASNN